MDSMGCQKSIAKQIVVKKGDYLLVVKGNEPKLLEATATVVIDPDDVELLGCSDLIEGRHGRTIG